MVDVSAKAVTLRRAVATAEVTMSAKTLALIRDNRIPKGDVFAVARIAGIHAAKQTASIVPLCHPLPIEAVEVEIAATPPNRVLIQVETAIRARTGVEMEALVGAAAAALAVYDMCKAVDRAIVIGPIQLEEKSGGRSGFWRRGGRARR
jgi:cyclic pyranopterin phosphate synthase